MNLGEYVYRDLAYAFKPQDVSEFYDSSIKPLKLKKRSLGLSTNVLLGQAWSTILNEYFLNKYDIKTNIVVRLDIRNIKYTCSNDKCAHEIKKILSAFDKTGERIVK